MNPDLLTELAALGVEYTIVGDKNGNARVNIANYGPMFGSVEDAIRQALDQHRRTATDVSK
jgi:hypothetical protein